MEISTSGNTVNITGSIKSVSDYQTIKATFDSLKSSSSSIIVNIVDSISITSSVIGYFNKLVLKDKVNLQLNIGNQQLMELLGDLHLVEVFKARKV